MNRETNNDNRDVLKDLLQSRHPREADPLLDVWDVLEGHEQEGEIDDDAEARVMGNLLEHTRSESASSRGRIIPLVAARVAVAAVILAMIFFAGLALYPVTENVGPGERRMVELPDESLVELNSGSSISYNRYFLTGRKVKMEGEAYFDVVSTPREFSIQTFNATVRVLGTSFNVKSRPKSYAPQTRVSLHEGSVELSGRSSLERVVMSPGESYVVTSAGGIESAAVPLESASAWRNGDLFFTDEPLGAVLEDVQRRFNTTIRLTVDGLAERRVNLSIRDPEDAETVVESVCGAYALNYRRVADGFEIF